VDSTSPHPNPIASQNPGAGRLRIVKQGAATLITASALDDYVKLLEREARARL
jgi:hypothetical protein